MLAALVLLAAAQSQMAPRDAAPTAPSRPTGTAIVRGRVVAADTGLPLRRALVSISGRSPEGHGRGLSLSIYTDAQGRYEARDLPAGSYVIQARPNQYQAQYLPQEIPQDASPDDLPRVNLADGQRLEGYDLALPRAGAIVGRIIDENGDPVGGAAVRILRPGDRSELGNYGAQSSDEFGRYRLFHLTPGEYELVVRPYGIADVFSPAEGPSLGFVETYYPGTHSREEARRVRVRGGQETSLGDFQLARTRMLHITGTVLDSRGAPPVSLTMVSLFNNSRITPTSVGRNGRFAFDQPQPPGTYRLIARKSDESGEDTLEYGKVAVTLVDADIEDVIIPMKATVNLTGRLVFDTAGPPAGSGSNQAIVPQTKEDTQLLLRAATVGADLTFTLKSIAGEVLLRPAGSVIPGWYLKAVLLGDRDITDVPTEFGADDSGRVRVVLTNRASELSGSVTNAKGEPVKSCNVVLFSEDRAAWFSASSRFRTVFTQGGRFDLKGLRPGRYYLVALPVERRVNEYTMDAAVLDALVREATALVLGEDEQRVVDLKLAGAGGL